jgi:hypothetical protein
MGRWRQWAAGSSGLVVHDLVRTEQEVATVTKVLIYVGAASVVGAGLMVLGFVISSDISKLGKGAVLALCLAAAAFSVFTIAAHQAGLTSKARKYRRLGVLCWCVGAAALVSLVVAAFTGHL